MSDTKQENFISSQAAEMLIRSHDGDCALLYLWEALRKSSDREQAAGELCMTRAQIDNAAEKLSRMGLSMDGSGRVSVPVPDRGTSRIPLPADEKPDYTPEEIVAVTNEDGCFRALRERLQDITGKTLSRNELSSLLGIYRHLGLPAEVIYVLFQYCSDITRIMFGDGRTPTMRSIEKTAYIWANTGLSSAEAAEDYAEKQKKLYTAMGSIRKALEIYDRRLTSNEQDFISSWLQMGYDEETIKMAYERTIDNIGKLSMPYMNKIILRWNEEGLLSPDQIERQEREQAGKNRKNIRSGKRRGNADDDFDPNDIDKISIKRE